MTDLVDLVGWGASAVLAVSVEKQLAFEVTKPNKYKLCWVSLRSNANCITGETPAPHWLRFLCGSPIYNFLHPSG
jgi:hypothetical protein